MQPTTPTSPRVTVLELRPPTPEANRPTVTIIEEPRFCLCFRLEEPPLCPEPASWEENLLHDDADTAEPDTFLSPPQLCWQVRYLLRSTQDLSLLLPAAQIWELDESKASFLKLRHANIREYFLWALTQAARICPEITQTLRLPQPQFYELDTTGAHDFLTHKAPALSNAGFGVYLPAWWSQSRPKRLQWRAWVDTADEILQPGRLSVDKILEFDWQVALGDQKLSEAELAAIADWKQPLIQMRGQWIELRPEEIAQVRHLWPNRFRQQAPVRDLLHMALGGSPIPGITVENVSASGWLADTIGRLKRQDAFELQAVPQGLVGQLRPYQLRGYSWLYYMADRGMGACLADSMGLGKTIQTLAFILKRKEEGQRRPVLIICPTSVIGNWQKEITRFAPGLTVLVHHGPSRLRGLVFQQAVANHDLVVSSYALLVRDLPLFQEITWGGMVLDEAQNIKNPQTKQAQAAFALATGFRFALTGTPVENNVRDLWAIMQFLNPGWLGAQSEFDENFFSPIQKDLASPAADQLQKLTAPFILRRLKTDKTIIADLPEKMEMTIDCHLTREQATLYQAVTQETEEKLQRADNITRRGIILAAITKLKQVCNHPRQFLGDNSRIPGRSGKLIRLTEMLEEIRAADERCLIFSQFYEMGEILRSHLAHIFQEEILFLHGRLDRAMRETMIARFQEEENGPKIFVLSLKAGGTGLNLTRANHVFHFDRWWNPAVEEQATDRAFRIGQYRDVQVYKFVSLGTLEEKIAALIENKKEIAGSIIAHGEGQLVNLSNEELRDFFAINNKAVLWDGEAT